MNSALDRVIDALHAAGSDQFHGGNWHCPGPGHSNGDRKPSLHVTSDSRSVALKCHTGCDTKDIVDILGLTMTDLFDEPLAREELVRYPYRDEDGKILFAKVRWYPKKFTIEHPVPGGWESGLGDIRRVIYNLPEVLAAIKSGETIWIAEGEKDADRLQSLGFTVTCNYDGASLGKPKWRTEYSQCFSGASRVIIIADRDEAGVAHAKAVRDSLSPFVKDIRIMQSRTERTGDDVSDHLDAGYSTDQLVPLHPENEISSRYRRTNWHDAFKATSDEIDWLYEPVLETGSINALFGKPGVGKSLLTWDVAVTLVREGQRVMVVDDENREQDTVKRLRAFGCTADELDNLILYSFAGLPSLDSPEGGEHLAALAEVNDPALIVLDTTTRMVSGDENNSSTWLQLYRNSLVPLKQQGRTVLRIDHPGKDESKGQRGSSAKAGDVDAIFRLSDISNSDSLVLICEKSRSGNHQNAITMKRLKDPLRHQVTALGDLDILPQVRGISNWFDRHDTPSDAGRPRLRDILNSTPGSPEISTTMLALVARYRKGQAQDNAGQGE